MINYTLQNLTHMIKKCCILDESVSKDPNDRYAFYIDYTKLENMLKQKKTNLHVIALDKSLHSEVPSLEDIQLLTEYIHDEKNYDYAFDGHSQTIQFMMFSMANENGDIKLNTVNENGENIEITDKQLFDFSVINSEDFNSDFVKTVCRDLPCYRIIVIRLFNYDSDKYEYKVNIRSNYNMVTYQKFEQQNASEEKSTEE